MPDRRDFIAIFKAEADEYLSKLECGIIELEKHPDNQDLIKELNRQAHSLKGASRVMGYNEIQDVAHRIEDIFDRLGDRSMVFNSSLTNIILKGLDIIKIILEKATKEEKIDVDIFGICRELENAVGVDKTENKVRQPEKMDIEFNKQEKEGVASDSSTCFNTVYPEKDFKVSDVAVSEEYVRVPVSRVSKLLNLIGEMVINKMKSSEKLNQLKRLSKTVKESQKSIFELEERMKKLFLLEDATTANSLSLVHGNVQRMKEDILSLHDNILNEVTHLDPVVNELLDKMKEIRMLPCSTVFEGFPRMVRDIAFQEHKEVALEILGADTELDRKVLEGIKVPLMHILRNCIDHGIETPEARMALGKPKQGHIKVSAFHEAGNVVISIEDDGRGIDIEQIKNTAIKKKLVPLQELEEMIEKEILNIVFMNGFSTADIITDVSGRGIGLDIVRRDIENLKGKIILTTQKNKGTKFMLVLPLTIAIIQVLLVKSGGIVFAMPISSIEQAIVVNKKEILTIENKNAIQVLGRTVPLVKLSEVLSLPALEEVATGEEINVAIVISLDKWVGFIVDKVVGEEEIFIKNLGDYLGKVKNVCGATILGRGDVVVVLDTADLVSQSCLGHPAVSARKSSTKEEKLGKRILIAEDTLTTRELEKSILEAEGYRVDVAVDGMDALDKAQVAKYDLIVTDIQMPRMDGFEFCRAIKKKESYKDIPVIIITALEKEEDKRRGIEAGAQAYIVKSTFNQGNLLDTIERLIG